MKKHYTPQQKAQLVLELLKEEKTVAQLAAEHHLHPNQLYKWKAQVLARLPDLFEDAHQTEKALKAEYEQHQHALYAEIGRLSTQLTWLTHRPTPAQWAGDMGKKIWPGTSRALSG